MAQRVTLPVRGSGANDNPRWRVQNPYTQRAFYINAYTVARYIHEHRFIVSITKQRPPQCIMKKIIMSISLRESIGRRIGALYLPHTIRPQLLATPLMRMIFFAVFRPNGKSVISTVGGSGNVGLVSREGRWIFINKMANPWELCTFYVRQAMGVRIMYLLVWATCGRYIQTAPNQRHGH